MKRSPAAVDRRLLALLAAAREGDLASRTNLNSWLREDAFARERLARLLVDEQALHNRLRDEQLIALLDDSTLPFATAPAAPAAAGRTARAWWTWAAAAAVALGFFSLAVFRLLPSSAAASPEPLPVAVLQNQAEATWRGAPIPDGTALLAGSLALESGIVALEFNNGARVIIEGPAEFDILSDDHVFFHSGRLSAEVPPPAQGFTISTPTMRVVDLGTRFGLSISPDGTGLVRVDKGEVEIHKNQTQRNLKEGEALAFDRSGEIEPSLFPDSLVPSEDDLRERLAIADSLRKRRWNESFTRISQDSAALLACNFSPEHPADRTIINLAAKSAVSRSISLVGASWSEGRWPGKSAVEFSGTGDRLRLDAQGYHQRLTMICWTRVDNLPNEYNGLLMPNGYRAGSVQWMLRRDGYLRFSMVNGLDSPGTPEGWDRVIIAPAIAPTDLGRWVFLATTYDSITGRVIHYRNGSAVGEGRLERPLPAHLGSMGVGNWAGGSIPSPSDKSPKPKSFYRNLVGRIDELAVLSRVLTPDEVRAYYEAGRP